MKVMVVDDSMVVLKLVESHIKELSDVDEVILCNESTDILKKIEGSNIDVLILDVVMPKKSGLEVLAEIRNERALDDLQVIMLTSEPKFFKESFNLGSDDFLNKPFEPVELQSRLKAALKTRKNIKMVHEINGLLKEKNKQLTRVNQELKETQFGIIQKEKQVLIGDLAGGMAHELNNPLGSIKSNLETLENFLDKISVSSDVYRKSLSLIEKNPDPEIQKILQTIRKTERSYKTQYVLSELKPLISDVIREMDKLAKIIQSIAQFSSSNTVEEMSVHSIRNIIEESLILIRNEYKTIIEVVADYDENDAITCNRSQIEQAIINILINAVHAIKSQNRTDRGKISIRTFNLKNDFLIHISDDGPGIPRKILGRIFDPFFTTKEIGAGTGLGLSTANDIIVHKHGGRLSAYNNPDGGATMEIVLPSK
ncbi:MAG: ATP-binding protein [Eubacteriales bacterium]